MEDAGIIELFFERSEQGIRELDIKYGKACRKLSYNIVNDRQDAEECVNDAYLGAWNAIPPVKPDPLLTYICKIVRNISLNLYHRKEAAKRSSHYTIAMEEIEACIAATNAVEAEIEDVELAHIIERFLDTLNVENRVIFMRRYWFSDSCRDIAGFMGLTEKNFKDILFAGADCVTMGNHTWGKKEIFKFIDDPKLIRPANYPKAVCGKGYNIYKCKDKKIAVINALGRAEINIMLDNPFEVVKEIVEKVKEEADIIMYDFHAEATAEKKAMAYYLDGEITAIFGTHTHTQTADEQILPNGTGYITDIGMTGPKNSVIGMDAQASIKRFETTGQISLLSLTKIAVALNIADDLRNIFTEIPYNSIEEVINERR